MSVPRAAGRVRRSARAVQPTIAAGLTPFNPALNGTVAGQVFVRGTAQGMALLDAAVNQQAAIIAYLDDFKAMLFVTAPAVLLLLLMKRPAPAPVDPAHAAME